MVDYLLLIVYIPTSKVKTLKLAMVAYNCNPSTGENEVERLQI